MSHTPRVCGVSPTNTAKMTNPIVDIAKHALMITSFVFVMMLVIEYVNVLTRGAWEERLRGRRWLQYVLAVALGVSPGCLGAFAVVAMYSHGSVGLGAVVAAMIATSGDESFVMLAMIPKQSLLLFGLLGITAFVAGALTDLVVGKHAKWASTICGDLELHDDEVCQCFPRGAILDQWKECSPARGILSVALALFLVALVAGEVGPSTWNWIRSTLLVASGAALFIVVTVPDHFLEEHLWRHVALTHAPRVFLWTLGALIAMHFLVERMHLENALWEGKWLVLLVACLVGLVPESGPHLIFLTLYAQGSVPFSVLLASSIVQDGHGMLPMLAHSRRGFLLIKGINLLVGLAAGATAMLLGY